VSGYIKGRYLVWLRGDEFCRFVGSDEYYAKTWYVDSSRFFLAQNTQPWSECSDYVRNLFPKRWLKDKDAIEYGKLLHFECPTVQDLMDVTLCEYLSVDVGKVYSSPTLPGHLDLQPEHHISIAYRVKEHDKDDLGKYEAVLRHWRQHIHWAPTLQPLFEESLLTVRKIHDDLYDSSPEYHFEWLGENEKETDSKTDRVSLWDKSDEWLKKHANQILRCNSEADVETDNPEAGLKRHVSELVRLHVRETKRRDGFLDCVRHCRQYPIVKDQSRIPVDDMHSIKESPQIHLLLYWLDDRIRHTHRDVRPMMLLEDEWHISQRGNWLVPGHADVALGFCFGFWRSEMSEMRRRGRLAGPRGPTVAMAPLPRTPAGSSSAPAASCCGPAAGEKNPWDPYVPRVQRAVRNLPGATAGGADQPQRELPAEVMYLVRLIAQGNPGGEPLSADAINAEYLDRMGEPLRPGVAAAAAAAASSTSSTTAASSTMP
jgi:hypothetical protein